MLQFKKDNTNPTGHIFVNAEQLDDSQYISYLLPTRNDVTELTLTEALQKHPGSLLFSHDPLPKEAETKLIALLPRIFPHAPPRGLIWLTDVNVIEMGTLQAIPINDNGSRILANSRFTLYSNQLDLVIPPANIQLNTDGIAQLRVDTIGPVTWGGAVASVIKPDLGAVNIQIYLEGPRQGCLIVRDVLIERRSLSDPARMRTGFQFICPVPETDMLQQQVYLLLDPKDNPDSFIGFHICLDVIRLIGPFVFNETNRTRFVFTGYEDRGEIVSAPLRTNYITHLGYALLLSPMVSNTTDFDPLTSASLVPYKSPDRGSREGKLLLSPAGDFKLSEPEGVALTDIRKLVCGLSGTELIVFRRGDLMRFVPHMPAFSDFNPQRTVQTVNPTIRTAENLLQNRYSTSWVQLKADPSSGTTAPHSIRYLAQPIGATLYGKGDIAEENKVNLFEFQLTDSDIVSIEPYPLVPYKIIQSDGDQQDAEWIGRFTAFERQVVSPVRRQSIKTRAEEVAGQGTPAALEGPAAYTATTPSGLLVAVTEEKKYKKVLLGSSDKSGGTDNSEVLFQDLSFNNVSPPLQKALQSNQLFLVATDARNLGGDPSISAPEAASFSNKLEINDWEFMINVDPTQGQHPMDYRNVLIVKGREGTSILDLVQQPEVWTQPDDFVASTFKVENSIPASASGDVKMLSVWLHSYINETISEHQEDSNYKYFIRAVTDPNWKGTLAVKVDINLPESLEGLTAGLDKQLFYAHHLGCETLSVSSDLQAAKDSSVFGLIYYKDPQFQQPDQLQSADTAEIDYEFKLLLLRVVIVNGKLADFYCLAHLILNKWFNQPVDKPQGDRHLNQAVLLEGSMQIKDGKSVYVMDTKKENVFLINSRIVDRIVLTKAVLQTVNENERMINRFALKGYLSFEKIQTKNDSAFDLFSFGNEQSEGVNVQPGHDKEGLSFSDIGIVMSIPRGPEGLVPKDAVYSFSARQAVFDIASSKYRKGSLFENFSMELLGFESGKGEGNSKVTSLGFTKINVPIDASWKDDEEWFALRFRLRAGTAGALMGNVSLQTELLLAWTADAGDNDPYNLFIGLRLAKGMESLPLQGVLKLDFGEAVLNYHRDTQLFYIQFHRMQLTFLGLKKFPPSGTTSLYLFGTAEPNQPLGWYAFYAK